MTAPRARCAGQDAVRLFLFDVDGTLVNARGAGRAAMATALQATYGTRGAIDAYDFRGKTDPQAVFDVLRAAGLPDVAIAGQLDACFARYARELEARIGDGRHVEVLPGIRDLIAALAARPDVIVGLLTGNIEAGARVKLQPTGLLASFRVGAYGSDDADRRRLPAVACARARDVAGHDIPVERVTVIGDTPLDVDCARACGAAVVAVATGHHARDELAACAPDALFTDFADVSAALVALLTLGPARAG